ncbi:hypothetical protein GF327_00575 [Candidatus Woesearchaeota archaeon]|nr:hypothetical protein [Candidatus Woesearchaeota archaeon]
MKKLFYFLITLIMIAGVSAKDFSCYADSVDTYKPGLNNKGGSISPDRSDSGRALGIPEETDSLNFASLGFSGELILKFDSAILDKPGFDFKVVETSYGSPSCSAYPEKVHVYASFDKISWKDFGVKCLDSEFDLDGLDKAYYLKLVDATDPDHFSGTVDAYDVDGVIAYSCEKIPDNVPEFSAIGMVLAALGSLLLFVFKRK